MGIECRGYETSVSETIRKPPLVKAQTALRKQKITYGEKRFSIWEMEFLHRFALQPSHVHYDMRKFNFFQ